MFIARRLRSLVFSLAAVGPLALAACGPTDCNTAELLCDEGETAVDTDDDGCPDTCEPDATCDALPSCNQGDTEVSDSGGCLQDDAVCYERELCGTTIWCTGPAYTQCMVDDDCSQGERCNTTDYCDTPIDNPNALVACTGRCEADVTCDAIPMCDDGHTEVNGESDCLQDDALCYERTLCGETIWCTGPDA